jgi:aldose 1-epimerase
MPGHPQPAPLPPSARRSRRRRRSLVAVLGAGLLTGGLAAPAGAADDRDRDGGGGGPSTSVEPFGATPDGTAVERWTLSNGDTTMRVLTFGGVIQTLEVPDAEGEVENVVLGFADLEGYVSEDDPYFGSLIGRYGNRIAEGRFTLDGATYQLPLNDGPNTLHGGTVASPSGSGPPPTSATTTSRPCSCGWSARTATRASPAR